MFAPLYKCFFFFAALATLLPVIVASPVSSVQVEKRARSGTATWFNVGLGNCGKTNVDSDWIVALATSTYNRGSRCGKTVTIKYGGKTAIAKVADSCPSCAKNDLDLSPSLFKHFASLDVGVLDMRWYFN